MFDKGFVTFFAIKYEITHTDAIINKNTASNANIILENSLK